MNHSTDRNHLDRRHLLGGAAALGVGLPLLTACGSGEPSTTTSTTDSPADPGSPTVGGDGRSNADGDGGAGGDQLVPTADVPIGGGVVIEEEKLVVTQPAEGEFKAFSAVCTHQGCIVATVEDNNINCPCHGSQFSAADGSVITGPATGALSEVAVQVKGDSVVRS